MTFEQLDLFPKEQTPDKKIEKVLSDEELAQRALSLYSNGEKSSIPEALVVVFGNENLGYDNPKFNRVKAVAERMLVEREKRNNVIGINSKKPEPTKLDYKMNQAKDLY